MPTIRTVQGDIDASLLGVCYPHEHLLGKPPIDDPDPDLIIDSEEAAIAELTSFHRAGGQSIVDLTPRDYNRNAEGLRRVSEATGVHIVAATGYVKEATGASFIGDANVDELAKRFIADIEEGIDGTGVRAGVIKAGTSLGKITEKEERVLRAAAWAHLATQVPISTHTEAGTMAMEQIDILTSEGVDPCHITIGHLDRRLEWVYHRKLAECRVFLGFDQISKEKYQPDRVRIDFIGRLIAEGFGDQLLLSGDFARQSYWPSYGKGGGPGLTYILLRFIPWLRFEGVTESAIESMLVDNPSRALSLKE